MQRHTFGKRYKTKDEVSVAQTLLTLQNNDKENLVADELDRMPSDPGCDQTADASHANSRIHIKDGNLVLNSHSDE